MALQKKAFSLIELSIVLVILGLLTGGVLAGKSLIRASELRSIGNDYLKYKTALYAFRDRYFYWPGDMRNAVTFWGAQAGGLAEGMDTDCRDLTAPATDKATCNGNGDGNIGSALNGFSSYESYRMWQHLANSGLIEGTFTGISPDGNGTYTTVLGQNVPAAKISGAGFQLRNYTAKTSADVNYFANPYGNVLWFGYPNPGAATLNTPVLRPAEAWNLDTKLDDGRPAFGKWLAVKSQTNCTTSSDPALSEYALSYNDIACSAMLLPMQ